MGKSWLACVSVACISPDKKHQKSEKEKTKKKKWFGKQKSRESIEFLDEVTPPVDPSSSSGTRLSYPPPPLPDFVPQPLLPPPSPPPLPPASASNTSYADSREAKTRQALALASAVAAEAAVVAAHAAAEVVRLTTTTSTDPIVESNEEDAAIKIQNAYRCYKARRTLRVLRGMARLKTLLQGTYVKRQMNSMLSSMQTLTRLQTQIQERRNRLSEENKARHRLVQQTGHQKEHNQNLVIEGDFDSSNKSKEQIEARFVHRKDASVRRERALAYAYSHQQTWRNSSKLPHQTLMDPNTPHWGWSWLERWMASRPWDPQSNDDQVSLKNSVKRENSIKISPARSKTLQSASQSSIQWPINNDSKRKQSERTNRTHSICGGSSGSVKDEESVGSSSSPKGSLSNTQTVKPKVSVETSNIDNTQAMKSKTIVGTTGNLNNTQSLKSNASMGTRGNLVNKQAVKSKVNLGTTSNMGLQKKAVSDKKKLPQMVLPKKRLSSSTSLGKTKLSDLDKAVTGAAMGEKKRRNVSSS